MISQILSFLSYFLSSRSTSEYFCLNESVLSGFRKVWSLPWTRKSSDLVKYILQKTVFQVMRIQHRLQSPFGSPPYHDGPSKWNPRGLPKRVLKPMFDVSWSFWTPRATPMALEKVCRPDFPWTLTDIYAVVFALWLVLACPFAALNSSSNTFVA